MVIKNKNGTEYKLRGPNPIMIKQDIWEGFELHNMNFHEETIESNNKTKIGANKLNLGKTVIVKNEESQLIVTKNEKTEDTKPSVVNQKPEEPKVNISFEADKDVIRPKTINEKLQNYLKDILCCLPADVRIITDKLYEEKTVKITYGQSFSFEAVIIKDDDLEFVFWSHLENIKKYSIIYPKNKTKRWWKVQSINEAPEGYFFACVPSEVHPSFEAN